MKRAVAFFLLISACAPMVEVTNVSQVDPQKLGQATQIKTYLVGQDAPRNFTVVAPITAYSCKHLMTDPPASSGDALLQLQLKALELNASAIVNVTFDTRGTDTFGTNCWETVQASGIAVRF
jgi:uncharacterized protein YbjQ (UPF0145 family)